MTLTPPFPWFGSKRSVADQIWSRLGRVVRYVEPFGGSAATLLARPDRATSAQAREIVNDLFPYIPNFYRAVQSDPDAVARYADRRIDEIELHAWNEHLTRRVEELKERLIADVRYYDAELAGVWVWGQCIAIGDAWCKQLGNGRRISLNHERGAMTKRAKPNVYNDRGILTERARPSLTHENGVASWRCKPVLTREIGIAGEGESRIQLVMRTLAERLDSVSVLCGNWTRVVTPAVLFPDQEYKGPTGVLLDPPYTAADRDSVYSEDCYEVGHAVREWAIEHGDDPRLRIALCGYDNVVMPDSWVVVEWKTQGGYANHGKKNRGRANAMRERIWFSPHCQLPDADRPLFQLIAKIGEAA